METGRHKMWISCLHTSQSNMKVDVLWFCTCCKLPCYPVTKSMEVSGQFKGRVLDSSPTHKPLEYKGTSNRARWCLHEISYNRILTRTVVGGTLAYLLLKDTILRHLIRSGKNVEVKIDCCCYHEE